MGGGGASVLVGGFQKKIVRWEAPSPPHGPTMGNPEGAIETKVYRKTTKLPVPWALNIPNWHERNTINTDLYCAKGIASNLDN